MNLSYIFASRQTTLGVPTWESGRVRTNQIKFQESSFNHFIHNPNDKGKHHHLEMKYIEIQGFHKEDVHLLVQWSLTSKIFTFVYFPFGKCESAPSLNNPVVQEKGQWSATGPRNLFELRLALNFIGQCALYYPAPPSLSEAATYSPLSPFEDSRGRQWRPGVTRLPTTAPPRQS